MAPGRTDTETSKLAAHPELQHYTQRSLPIRARCLSAGGVWCMDKVSRGHRSILNFSTLSCWLVHPNVPVVLREGQLGVWSYTWGSLDTTHLLRPRAMAETWHTLTCRASKGFRNKQDVCWPWSPSKGCPDPSCSFRVELG